MVNQTLAGREPHRASILSTHHTRRVFSEREKRAPLPHRQLVRRAAQDTNFSQKGTREPGLHRTRQAAESVSRDVPVTRIKHQHVRKHSSTRPPAQPQDTRRGTARDGHARRPTAPSAPPGQQRRGPWTETGLHPQTTMEFDQK